MNYLFDIIGPLLNGSVVTLKVFFITLVLSVPLGLALALIRVSHFRVASGVVSGYIWLMRGTPLMLQLYVLFFLLPEMGIELPALVAGIGGLAINYSAYEAEIYRAGLQAIPGGQMEAIAGSSRAS